MYPLYGLSRHHDESVGSTFPLANIHLTWYRLLSSTRNKCFCCATNRSRKVKTAKQWAKTILHDKLRVFAAFSHITCILHLLRVMFLIQPIRCLKESARERMVNTQSCLIYWLSFHGHGRYQDKHITECLCAHYLRITQCIDHAIHSSSHESVVFSWLLVACCFKSWICRLL